MSDNKYNLDVGMIFSRSWAMPNKNTFSIKPIAELIARFRPHARLCIDMFARDSRIADITNDLNPNTAATHHLKADAFLAMLFDHGDRPDLILFDPPYSPRQISECYAEAGLKAGMTDTQNARLMKSCRDGINAITEAGAVCLSFGWNSSGMGNGWEILEVHLVAHGGAHNDTICVVSRRL